MRQREKQILLLMKVQQKPLWHRLLAGAIICMSSAEWQNLPLFLILRSSRNTLWNVEIVWASPEQCQIDLVEGWNGLKGIVPFDSLFWFKGRVWGGLWQWDIRVRVYLPCNSVLICWVWCMTVNKSVSQSDNGAAICAQQITVCSSRAKEQSPTMDYACSHNRSD